MRYQAALRPDCSTNTADKRKFKGYIDNKFLINLALNAIRYPMIIECPNCYKKFSLDKKLIPENGRTLKCSSCYHIWHYKIPITESIDDIGISEDKNTNLDADISEVKKKDFEHNEEINDENLTDTNHEILSEENTESEDDDINDEKENEKKQGKINMILIYFIVVIISLLGLIFLLDTFKSYLFSIFPSVAPLFDSFYETLLDLKLFIKDLTN